MKAGSEVIAVRNMIVHDVEDSSIPPVKIKKGDIGVIKVWGIYEEGPALEISIRDTEAFLYPRSFAYCFKVVESETKSE